MGEEGQRRTSEGVVAQRRPQLGLPRSLRKKGGRTSRPPSDAPAGGDDGGTGLFDLAAPIPGNAILPRCLPEATPGDGQAALAARLWNRLAGTSCRTTISTRGRGDGSTRSPTCGSTGRSGKRIDDRFAREGAAARPPGPASIPAGRAEARAFGGAGCGADRPHGPEGRGRAPPSGSFGWS